MIGLPLEDDNVDDVGEETKNSDGCGQGDKVDVQRNVPDSVTDGVDDSNGSSVRC